METGLFSSDLPKRQQGFADSSCELIVNVGTQTLEVHRDGALTQTYPISTSKYGLGTEEGSNKTPTGNFVIAKKIGHDAPPFSVFKSRIATGEIASPGGEEDLIMSRILWLDGKDQDNANTYQRYIYIHGTNQEEEIGTPASHGCIRMRNQDVALLFDQVPVGTPVQIRVG